MDNPFVLADAFAFGALSGNPAGVVLLQETLPDEVMQETASEVNQAETAFLLRQTEGWSLRWFTPSVEVDLCGHATLASAAALQHWGFTTPGELLKFSTRSGPLTAELLPEGIQLDFPNEGPTGAVLPACLDFPRLWEGRSRMDWMAVLASSQDVEQFVPDMAAIAQAGMRGLIITSVGGDSEDVCSRFFAPQSGVPEDPVTGSAHCTIAPYWAKELDKSSLVCRQASPRGGRILATVKGDRVLLVGEARIRIVGDIRLTPS